MRWSVALILLILSLTGCAPDGRTDAERFADQYLTDAPHFGYELRVEFDDGSVLRMLVFDQESNRCYQMSEWELWSPKDGGGDARFNIGLAGPEHLGPCP